MKKNLNSEFSWELLLALLAVVVALGLGNLPNIMDNRLLGLIGASNGAPVTVNPATTPTAAPVATPLPALPQTAGIAEVKSSEFRLEIARLGISHAVTPNVDPRDKAIYGPVIEQQVAHGMFTRLPDQATLAGNVYLFAHRNGSANGKNIGFFHRLNELRTGDQAVVQYHGRKYTYEYREQFVINPTDTWVYTGESDTPTLTLQTCENGETKRLIAKFLLIAVE